MAAEGMMVTVLACEGGGEGMGRGHVCVQCLVQLKSGFTLKPVAPISLASWIHPWT